MEDIPTGVIPILELGNKVGLEMPIYKSIVSICSNLLDIDFSIKGRTLRNLGYENYSVNEILNAIK